MTSKIDLSKLSVPELQALRDDAAHEIEKRAKEDRAALLASFEQQAKVKGFALADLLPMRTAEKPGGKKSGKTSTGSVPPKYRNPENAAETWAGRGRMPEWVKAFKEAGRNLDDCLIEQKAA